MRNVYETFMPFSLSSMNLIYERRDGWKIPHAFCTQFSVISVSSCLWTGIFSKRKKTYVVKLNGFGYWYVCCVCAILCFSKNPQPYSIFKKNNNQNHKLRIRPYSVINISVHSCFFFFCFLDTSGNDIFASETKNYNLNLKLNK